MGRNPRIFLPDYPIHVVQRGHDRRAVFCRSSDHAYYLDNLVEAKAKFGICVYAYCLMSNHVHLILAPCNEPSAISALMKTIAARQTRYSNKRLGRSGTLWEGRFKASLIDTDRYLLACMRYVDLNPVRAAIVDAAEDYEWSSYRAHAGFKSSSIVDIPDSFRKLGGTDIERYQAYKDLVTAGSSDSEIALIRSALQRNQLTGGSGFMRKVAAKTGMRIEARGRGRPPKNAVTLSSK